jgi:hypothetical protein
VRPRRVTHTDSDPGNAHPHSNNTYTDRVADIYSYTDSHSHSDGSANGNTYALKSRLTHTNVHAYASDTDTNRYSFAVALRCHNLQSELRWRLGLSSGLGQHTCHG